MEQNNRSLCPHIGGPKDKDTFYQYPSNWNRCYRADPAIRVSQAHQRDYCLCEQHHACEIYQPNWNGVVPEAVVAAPVRRARTPRSNLSGRQLWVVIGFILVAVVVLVGAFLGLHTESGRADLVARLGLSLGTGGESANSTAVISATETSTVAPTETVIPTNTATPLPSETPEPTLTPTITSTPFPTPGPGFGTPFGPEAGFAIHVVVVGESYTSIARRYGTSPAVIEAVNQTFEGASLWVGQQLVVPINTTNPAGLPIFSVVFTTEAIELEELARLYSSDTEAIRFYNSIGASDSIPSGRWLIIPLVESN